MRANLKVEAKGVTLSIMIPTFNRPESLEKMLVQIFSQALPKYTEILISENANNAKYPESLSQLLKDQRVRYIRQRKNIGLLGNARFLRGKAIGRYHCMLHDDDLLSEHYFKTLITYLDDHPSCVMAVPRGIRHYNGSHWYDYEEYSSCIGNPESNIANLISRVRGPIWSIEHIYYSVYRGNLDTTTLDCGRPGSIFAHLVGAHRYGYVSSIDGCSIIKNTTYRDLVKYSEASYFRRSFLDGVFGRKLSLKVQTRALITSALIKLVLKDRSLSFAAIIRLLIKCLVMQIWRGPVMKWATPRLSECREPCARNNQQVWATYFIGEVYRV